MGAITVREVHKSFSRVRAVRGISLDIERGQVTALLGPNGAGKSTTIRMITAFLPPDRGQIRVCGYDTQSDSLNVRQRIGYLPEDAPMYPEMSVQGYLRFRAALCNIPPRQRRRAVERAMDRCSVAHVRRRRIGHLSKGYRQRVGLAGSILHDPPVIILDEPTNGLDPAQIREVRSLVRELGESHAVLVSSHILAEVERTCDRVVIIAHGRICADGTPDALIAPLAPSAPYRARVRTNADPDALVDAIEDIEGVARAAVVESETPDSIVLEVIPRAGTGDLACAIGHALANHGCTICELSRTRPSLESIFLQSVEEDAS